MLATPNTILNISFTTLTLILVALGLLILGFYAHQQSQLATPAETVASAYKPIAAQSGLDQQPQRKAPIPRTDDPWLEQLTERLRTLLEQGKFDAAIGLINQNYERASAAQLDRIKALIVNFAAAHSGRDANAVAIRLLRAYTEEFDDLDAWRMLASAYSTAGLWAQAVDVLLHATGMENDLDRYATSLRALENSASQLRAAYSKRNDKLQVLALYKRIYEQYPQHPRFQMELAQALLETGDVTSARRFLDGLRYDPDLGALAAQLLATLAAEQRAAAQPTPAATNSKPQIVVPLIRAGNSLLVDTYVEGSAARMLLDTGASVTALSASVIEQLGLRPTGEKIRLTTANGITSARLFRANRLEIGRVAFTDLIVAEIDLSNDRQIVGLLGTDVLRRMDNRYSYVIDDQQNALIFKAR